MKTIRRSQSPLLAVLLVMAVGVAIASKAKAADPAKGISAASKAVRDTINLKAPDGCSHINGFNYQPSWGHNGLTVWGDRFDAKKYREELTLGKKYFPKFNAVRMWLSWSAYRANPEQFVRNFQQAVDICGELDLLVVPVIFNRWPGNPLWDRVEKPEIAADFDATFGPFIRALVVPMKGDLRLLVWDLCNEPYNEPAYAETETQWLGKVRAAVKQCDLEALTSIGTMPNVEQMRQCAHLQDILTPHLYFPVYVYPPKSIPAKLEDSTVPSNVIAVHFALAKQLGKAMMCTECCWSADDDAERAGIIRANLQALKEYKIGFFPHALHTSGVADLHKYKEGGLYMPFILEDGSLRPGHDVYNEFAQ
jgi:hypothetical protein